MTASFLSAPVRFAPTPSAPVSSPAAVRVPARRWRSRRGGAAARHGGPFAVSASSGVPLALAAVLLLLAVLLAPEQPGDQEAICQRHNGVAACRVW